MEHEVQQKGLSPAKGITKEKRKFMLYLHKLPDTNSQLMSLQHQFINLPHHNCLLLIIILCTPIHQSTITCSSNNNQFGRTGPLTRTSKTICKATLEGMGTEHHDISINCPNRYLRSLRSFAMPTLSLRFHPSPLRAHY